jgi:glycosyltransferase involved in cell wall biosynthesis
MRWIMIAPFMRHSDNKWLGRFIQGTRHSFDTLPADYVHDRSRSHTDLAGWLDYFRHAWRALRAASGPERVGLITSFPQLPLAVGLLSILLGKRVPVVAWTFNVGMLPSGLKRAISRHAFRRIDAFIVHSRAEIDQCSKCFGIDKAKLVFVPLQTVYKRTAAPAQPSQPYVVAMGSAGRDYALLFDVLRDVPLKTIVVAGAHAVSGLEVPDCVEIRSGLTRDECLQVLQDARMSVVPVANESTASGQVTLLDSMAAGIATIVTRCPGSVDYVTDGTTAILVAPGNEDELRDAMTRVWNDERLRESLGKAGEAHVLRHFSDAAVAQRLRDICDAVENNIPLSSIGATDEPSVESTRA